MMMRLRRIIVLVKNILECGSIIKKGAHYDYLFVLKMFQAGMNCVRVRECLNEIFMLNQKKYIFVH